MENLFQEKFKTFIEDTHHDVLGEENLDLPIPEAMYHLLDSCASQSIIKIFDKLKQVLWS